MKTPSVPQPRTSYAAPVLVRFGTVESLTRASANSNAVDSIFFNGVLVGNLQGSLDACVSVDPQNPQGTCNVP